MPIRSRAATTDQVIREENVATGTQRICYPSVSSCITVTGYHADRLIGCHITNQNSLFEINTIFHMLKENRGTWCTAWYVVGRIDAFKDDTSVQEFKTKKRMKEYIQTRFPSAQVLFFDTAAIQESDIFAVKSATGVAFSYRPGSRTSVSGFTYPAVTNATDIAASQFRQL